MIVDCPSCGATYNISDEKVRGRRVRVRCKNCSGPIIVDGEELDAEDATRVYQPSFEPNTYDDTDESTRVMSAGSGDPSEAPPPGAWTVNVSDADQRTMTLEEIVDTYNAGFITEDAFVWRAGMSDWVALMQVEEIRSAIESGEATKVVKPAALRATARRAAANPPTPVTYSGPSAPPRARLDPTPPKTVEYAPPAPSLPLAPAPARVRDGGRHGGQDLFGAIATAGSEQELLRSSSMPLESYAEKPTGARNESSVLFSLNTLKAGVATPASAPPRGITAAPPTAADILGMDMAGGLPGVDVNAALTSAPVVEQRPSTVPPPRNRMDTLPPTAKRRNPPLLIAAVVVAAGAMLIGLVLVVRARMSHTARTGSDVTAETAASAATTPAPAVPPLPAAAANPTPVASAAAPPSAATAPAEPAPPAAAAPVPPPVTASPAPPALQAAAVQKAPVPAHAAPAVRAATAPEKAPPDKGERKVVLEEDPSDKGASAPAPADDAKGASKPEAPAEAPPAEPDKPPFDMSAAKAALETAAASAPSCKTPDGPTGKGKVQVTFSPSGHATSANVIEGSFGGTSVGGCIAKLFRSARVPPFSGDPVTVAKSFTVPE